MNPFSLQILGQQHNMNILQQSKSWLFSENTLSWVTISPSKITVDVTFSLEDKIYNAIMDGASIMYITTQSYLRKYSVGKYPYNGKIYFSEDAKKFNPNQDIIVACGENDILSVQPYNGAIVIRNKDTMESIKTYSGIDSPTKAVWSNYHSAYIVMGANGLWKITRNVSDLVFSVDGYALKDIAVNLSGHIGIVLSSKIDNKDIIKVLGNDFFKNVLSPSFDYGTVKSIVLAKDIFYAIQETPPSAGKYNGNGILIDTKTKTYEKIKIVATAQKEESTTPTTTTAIIEVITPVEGDTLAIDQEYDIKWVSSKSATDNVSISLINGAATILEITDGTPNTGNYKWKVPSNLELNGGYTLKITWLTSNQNNDNSGTSGSFIISDTEPPPEEVDSSDYISGISYDTFTNSVILTFYSGYVGVHDLSIRKFYGLFKSDLVGVNGNIASNDQTKQFDDVSKVRIFVGSERYLSDKWDSGVVETKLTSMYYGGGNNLLPGKKYYVHIQVYSEKYGWSEVQIKDFVMPL